MQMFNRSLAAVSALALAPGIAVAHEGEHGGALTSGFLHVISEPDHLAIVCLGAALIGCVTWAVRSLGRKGSVSRRARD